MRVVDEDLIRRLPMPLAQLYHSAHSIKAPLERYLAAYFLWEASFKLLGSVAIVEYARLGRHDAELTERLKNLSRPALGHWWEFIRLLVPVLADAEGAEGKDTASTRHPSFCELRDWVLGPTRHDLPHAAGLDALLCADVDNKPVSPRSTVRLSDLFDRLVRHRNKYLGHGATGQLKAEFYEQTGRALLAAAAEVLQRLDLLAGRRLIHVADVRRQASGSWLIERYELVGETGRLLESRAWSGADLSQLPCPGRVYLEQDSPLVGLHPLVVYEPEAEEVLFLNARRGRQRTEYLCYSSGRVLDRKELAGEHQTLLAQVLDMPVDEGTAEEWAKRAEEENPAEPAPEPTNGPPRRMGDFELLSILGQGGMGVVYRAWQPSLGRQIALKCLLRTGDARAEGRFAREIRALGRVKHPNLVEIFTSGSAGEQWFYAMELVEGTTLAGVCEHLQAHKTTAEALNPQTWRESLSSACEASRRGERRLSAEEPAADRVEGLTQPPPATLHSPPERTSRAYLKCVAELVRQVAEAAHALHEAGVVHRDIKPGNIIVTPDGGHAILMDLGLAKLTSEPGQPLTQTRHFVGTLPYASPEQVHGAQLDRRSDVYSLGATLWELLTLRHLHGIGEQMPTHEVEQRILFHEAERVRVYNRAVPADLEAIVLKCLEKDPRGRYATAGELAADLQCFLDNKPVKARPIGRLRRGLRAARQRPLRVLAVLTALLLLGAAAWGLGYWDTHYRLKIDYYATFVNRWGVTHGISRLSEEQVRHRRYSYKFYSRGGRVEKVEAVNGKGQLTTQHGTSAYISSQADRDRDKRECRYEYRRNERGELTEEIATDRIGDIVWIFHFTTPTTGHHTDKNGFPRARAGSGAAYIAFTWSDQGYPTEIRYFDRNGRPQPDSDGDFGERREVDERGLVVQATDLDADGRPRTNKYGYSSWRHQRDAMGNVTDTIFLDEKGQPIRHKDGNVRRTTEYDAYGNRLAVTYRDQEGRLILHKSGYARWTCTFDEDGHEVELAYFGCEGQPVLCKDGYTRATYVCNEHGDTVETRYFGLDGKPVPHKNGFFRWTKQFDEHGNRVGTNFFDEHDRPTNHLEGDVRYTSRYDDRGNLIETSFFDENDKPIRLRFGYARVTNTYDDAGNRVEVRYFDESGRPTRRDKGYARWTGEYDDRGNLVEERFFDEEGRPVRDQNGVARTIMKYDKRGDWISFANFDEFGSPTRYAESGVHKTIAKRDERGNMIEVAYFDENDKPLRNKNGWAGEVRKFDRWGNQIEVAFHDLDGALLRRGSARWKDRYDERGNRIERAFFDSHGQPTVTADGYAHWTARYDERGNRLEQTAFGRDGKPALLKDGYTTLVWSYDERCNQVREEYRGLDGRPIALPSGYARIATKYDRYGNDIEFAYSDLAGKPVRSRSGYARRAAKYDASGHRVESAYFDEHGKPAPGENGVVRWTARFDRHGQEIERAYLGADGKPASGREGFAKRTVDFDEHGQAREIAYFDPLGRLMRGPDGYARAVRRFDDQGHEIERLYLDESAKLVRGREGFARGTRKYDEHGHPTEAAFWDAEGKPARNVNIGSARQTAKYDARGNRVETTFWGLDGKDGYFRKTTRYDARGNAIEVSYFDDKGVPVPSKAGYARMTIKFDDLGRRLEEAYWAPNGAPATDKNGHARWTAGYDDKGNRIEDAYFGPDGKPAPYESGYCRARTTYDEDGNRVAATFLGYNGKDGYAQKTLRYDRSGNTIEGSFADADGKRVVSKLGYAGWTVRYDHNGHHVETKYVGPDGQPAADTDGCARWTLAYDENGRQIEEAYFGRDGQPSHYGTGYLRWRATYDERGNRAEQTYWGYDGREGFARKTVRLNVYGDRIAEAYFDRDGQPARCKSGYDRITSKYDSTRRLTERTFLGYSEKDGFGQQTLRYDGRGNVIEGFYGDRDGKLIAGKLGYARWTNRYDKDGNFLEKAYFGPAGKPAADKDGHARWTAKYDEKGRRIEEAYFGLTGQPARYASGYSRRTTKYDARGQRTEETYMGYDGRDGYSRKTLWFDEHGNTITEAYADDLGEPIRCKAGYAKIVYKYDVNSRLLEKTFLNYAEKYGFYQQTMRYDGRGHLIGGRFADRSGQLVPGDSSYAGWESRYDEKGRHLETSYFGTDHKPIAGRDGLARWARAYDDNGRQIEEAYYGRDGQPLRYNTGYVRWTAKYDSRGNRIERTFWGYDGREGYVRKTVEYNAHGDPITEAYFDDKGEPVRCKVGYRKIAFQYDATFHCIEKTFLNYDGKDGYFQKILHYDERGNNTEGTLRDRDGKLVRGNLGYAGWKLRYDKNGRQVETSYFGPDQQPAANKDGFAHWTLAYDAKGRQIEEAYFGLDGQPARDSNGSSRWTAKYDDIGRRIEQTSWGYDGKDGYAQKTRRFDRRGNEIEGFFGDPDGKLVRCTSGYAGWIARYDENGRHRETRYFGPNRQPAARDDGVARWTREYDDNGRQIEEATFGLDRQPIRDRTGYIRWTAKHDEQGRRVELTFWGYDGKDGFVHKGLRYDPRGNNTEIRFLDAASKPALNKQGAARIVWTYDADNQVIDLTYFDTNDKPLPLDVVVLAVQAGGQGQRLGVKAGDILLSYDGKAIANSARFITVRRGERADDKPRELRVQRDKQTVTFQLQPGLLGIELQNTAVRQLPPQAAK